MKLCDLKMVTISCKQSAISMDGGVTRSSLTAFLPFFGLLGQFWSGLNNVFGWMVGCLGGQVVGMENAKKGVVFSDLVDGWLVWGQRGLVVIMRQEGVICVQQVQTNPSLLTIHCHLQSNNYTSTVLFGKKSQM